MPPYIDGIHEPGQLFFRTGDGLFVPFPGIQELMLPKTDDPAYADAVCIKEAAESTITGQLTKQSEKALKKLIRPMMNKRIREIRKYKRKKEKIRRMILKSGGICIL